MLTNHLSKTKEHAASHGQGLPVLAKVDSESDTSCVQTVPDHLVQPRVEHGQGQQAHVLTRQQPQRVPKTFSHRTISNGDPRRSSQQHHQERRCKGKRGKSISKISS